MAASTPWWITALTVALAGAGLFLGAWALFWDRARGRLRCPKCWYDMHGAEQSQGAGFTCPECGRTGMITKDLRRTRRRWGSAGLAIIIIAASAVLVATRKEGPLSIIPSGLLVRLPGSGELEWLDGCCWRSTPDNAVANELLRRYYADELTGSPMRHWLTRVENALRADNQQGVSEATRLVHRRLHSTIVKRDFSGMTLEEVFAELEELSAISFTVAWEDLASDSLTADTTVKTSIRGLSVAHAMERIIEEADDPWPRCKWTCSGNSILIGNHWTLANAPVIAIYDVEELVALRLQPSFSERADQNNKPLSEKQMCQRIMDLIIGLVDTESWSCMGGELGMIEGIARRIIVGTIPRHQLAVEDLLQRLQALAVNGDAHREQDQLESMHAKVERLTQSSITFDGTAMSATDLVDLMSEQSPCEVAMDWTMLEDSGITPGTMIIIPAGELPLLRVIEHFAAKSASSSPPPAAWSLCDDQLLITSGSAAQRCSLVLLYDVADLVAGPSATSSPDSETAPPGRSVGAIGQMIMNAIDPNGWHSMGGETSAMESFGNILAIQTTPRNHLQIDSFLSRLRDEPARSSSDHATDTDR